MGIGVFNLKIMAALISAAICASVSQSAIAPAAKESAIAPAAKETAAKESVIAPAAKEVDMKEMYDLEKEFTIETFDRDSEIFARIKGKSFKDDCTVPVEDLRYLRLLYKNFDGETCRGEMICNAAIAEDLIEIFKELYANDYAIEKIRLVDEYDADDERSMADNNSSAFNFRFISYTTKVSKHGLGLAVDINPLYNPYIKQVNGKTSVEPANATEYVDRSKDFEHKIDENDLAYRLFTEHGFEWGGSWTNSKDYQHFEISPEVIKNS